MQIIKMRSVLKGEHVHTTFFQGQEGQTLHNVGTLCQRVGEWQLFGAMVLLGQDSVNENYPRVRVVSEGDKEIIDEFLYRDQEAESESKPELPR